MTGVQLALDIDCEPTWTTRPQPDHTMPTPGQIRLAELADLADQGTGPTALRTATTIPTGRYL